MNRSEDIVNTSPCRIVSLEPSVTAIVYALGQQERLVAVSKYCERLVDVGDKPRLAPTWSADAQAIAALAPDLVIASVPYRSESINALLQARLNVLMLYPQRLQDVYAHILWLGRLCQASERAQALVAEMQTALQALRPPQHRPRPRVYYEVWPQPLISAPGWVADLIDLVGGQCLATSSPVSEQDILAADPEIIIVAWAGIEPQRPDVVLQRPGWEHVTAVRQRRVIPANEIRLNAPGPNLLEGARELATIIQTV